jgi:hypothetical protein
MKVSNKMTVTTLAAVGATVVALVGMVLVQKGVLRGRLNEIILRQGLGEAGKVAQSIYSSCAVADQQCKRQLMHSLAVARESMSRLGPVAFASETVHWQAVNQVSKDRQEVALPKMLLGETWLGQNHSPGAASPVVDELKHYTQNYATIFQRMNEAGDMLRVCTSPATSVFSAYAADKKLEMPVNIGQS